MVSRLEINKFFFSKCKVRYGARGFVRQRNGFYRVINDVLQTFSLQYSADGKSGRICFGIYPLCMELKYIVDVGQYYLDQFAEEQDYYSFDRTIHSNAEECLEKTFWMLDTYLIPFFNKAIDCHSAFTQTLNLDYLLDSIRIKRLSRIGCTDSAEPIEIRTLYDASRFYISLKLHNFDWARKHLSLCLQATEESYKRALLIESDDIEWKNSYCQRLSTAIYRIRNELSFLDMNNIAIIDCYLEKQEKENRERLKI